MKVLAKTLKVGDVIIPPAREVSLWMKRHAQERGLSESAMHLTINNFREGASDKKGAWLIVDCDHTAEWIGDSKLRTFSFKVRPESLWIKI